MCSSSAFPLEPAPGVRNPELSVNHCLLSNLRSREMDYNYHSCLLTYLLRMLCLHDVGLGESGDGLEVR